MWILVNIGCLECGVSSNIVGVFNDFDDAEKIKTLCDSKFEWRENGQNEFKIFEMPEVNKINNEYVV